MTNFLPESYQIPQTYSLYEHQKPSDYNSFAVQNKVSPPKPKIMFDAPFYPNEKNFHDPYPNSHYQNSYISPRNEEVPLYQPPYKFESNYESPKKSQHSPIQDEIIIHREFEPVKEHPEIRLEYPDKKYKIERNYEYNKPQNNPSIFDKSVFEYTPPNDFYLDKLKQEENIPIIRLEYPVIEPALNPENLKEHTKKSGFIDRSSMFSEIPYRREDLMPKITFEDRPFSNLPTLEAKSSPEKSYKNITEIDEKCNGMQRDVLELKNSLEDRLKFEKELEIRNIELENELGSLRHSVASKGKEREDKVKRAGHKNDDEVPRLKNEINALKDLIDRERAGNKKNDPSEAYLKVCRLTSELKALEEKARDIENQMESYRARKIEKKQNRLNMLNNMINNLKNMDGVNKNQDYFC